MEGWRGGASVPGPAKNVNKPFLQPYWHRCCAHTQQPHLTTYNATLLFLIHVIEVRFLGSWGPKTRMSTHPTSAVIWFSKSAAPRQAVCCSLKLMLAQADDRLSKALACLKALQYNITYWWSAIAVLIYGECRWGGEPWGRHRAMPHIKSYTRYKYVTAIHKLVSRNTAYISICSWNFLPVQLVHYCKAVLSSCNTAKCC